MWRAAPRAITNVSRASAGRVAAGASHDSRAFLKKKCTAHGDAPLPTQGLLKSREISCGEASKTPTSTVEWLSRHGPMSASLEYPYSVSSVLLFTRQKGESGYNTSPRRTTRGQLPSTKSLQQQTEASLQLLLLAHAFFALALAVIRVLLQQSTLSFEWPWILFNMTPRAVQPSRIP